MRRIINHKDKIIKSQQSKIKMLNNKNRRYKKKIIKLEEILKELQANRLINSDQAMFLENTNLSTKHLFDRCTKRFGSGKVTRKKY